jgi:predicted nucleic acid-binding Zn ribbon protein
MISKTERRCKTCLARLPVGEQMFCCEACRELYWCARRVLREYGNGMAPVLADIAKRIGEVRP